MPLCSPHPTGYGAHTRPSPEPGLLWGLLNCLVNTIKDLSAPWRSLSLMIKLVAENVHVVPPGPSKYSINICFTGRTVLRYLFYGELFISYTLSNIYFPIFSILVSEVGLGYHLVILHHMYLS